MKRYRDENGQLTMTLAQLKQETAAEAAAYYHIGGIYFNFADFNEYVMIEAGTLAHFQSFDGKNLFIPSDSLGTFLPDVASCHAMNNLLQQRQNIFYHDYQVIVCAGPEAGTGANALPPVLKALGGNPLESKTITLSCGKLTTGITVKPWSGIFMLRNLSSPETYFQAAFRVQSPWTVDSDQPGKKEIVKPNCYVFDFALDRALKQIADYSCRLNANPGNPETKVKEFISFLPVLAYDGSAMKQVEASEILDMAMAGTSATLLARRWESALLVNVDNVTLQRLLASREAMDALMSIEGFRNLNSDLETIINKSDAVKGMRKEKDDLTHKLSLIHI